MELQRVPRFYRANDAKKPNPSALVFRRQLTRRNLKATAGFGFPGFGFSTANYAVEFIDGRSIISNATKERGGIEESFL
jgi:hypothetical protein